MQNFEVGPDMVCRARAVAESHQVDAAGRLKPQCFMDLAQEMAYRAADALGFGYAELGARGLVWVLSRMHFVVADPPRWNQQLELATWCRGLEGLFYVRDFEVSDPATGRVLIAATSSWNIIDTASRRLVRGGQAAAVVPTRFNVAREALPGTAPKVDLPRGVEPALAGTHRVAYSDVDIVGHANNARYLAWALDTLPPDRPVATHLREASICFSRECPPGLEVGLLAVDLGQGRLAMAGESRPQGQRMFTLELQF